MAKAINVKVGTKMVYGGIIGVVGQVIAVVYYLALFLALFVCGVQSIVQFDLLIDGSIQLIVLLIDALIVGLGVY
ncbi:MAG: hypothetical protein ACFFFG_06650 [Candidatus Thorarchaeota archaeon]